MSSREYGSKVTCPCGHEYRSNIIGQSGCPYVKPCSIGGAIEGRMGGDSVKLDAGRQN